MAVGSTTSFYRAGSFYKAQSGAYTPGSIYKKFNPSNATKMNRAAIGSQISGFSNGIARIYSTNASFWNQLSTLTVEGVKDRIMAELQAKADEATARKGSLLNLSA